MESTNNKIITISYMAASLLIGIVVFVLLESLAAVATGGVGRFVSQDLVRHGVPVAFGLIAFIVLQSNSKIHVWANEVVVELRKIVWPSRKDTVAMTIMVCVMLLISGVFLGLLDVVSGTVIEWLLHNNFGGLF